MKHFFILLAILGLTACQTTPEVKKTTKLLLQPVDSEVLFGTEPIHRGLEHNTWKFVFKNGTRTSTATIQNKVAVELVSDAKAVTYDIRILESNISLPHFNRENTKTEDEMDALRGKEFQFIYRVEKNKSESIASFGDLKEGYINLMGAGRELVKSMIQMSSKSYFGGKSVMQDDEVLAMDFCVVTGTYPGGSGPCDSTEFFGHVVGKSIYHGRSVVVVKVKDDILHDEQKIDTGGIFYIDINTGAALFSEITLSGMKRDETNLTIIKTRSMKLSAL